LLIPHFKKSGLWKYSRHPNYLGQCLFWFGLGAWGVHHGAGWIVFALSQNIVGLIVFYSIPAMEQKMLQTPSRRKAFENYQKSTSRFILWPSN
jgi:steroid 5-alpha reductase family enzyme